VVAYSNEIAAASGVPEETTKMHGTVSPQTASAMAEAIRGKLGADFGIGIAGVAGPGKLEGKPVGQLYLAIAGPGQLKDFELRVPPRRITIKRRAANTALTELRKMITAMDGVPN
jgi:nicotinamide-nucleotide amidase